MGCANSKPAEQEVSELEEEYEAVVTVVTAEEGGSTITGSPFSQEEEVEKNDAAEYEEPPGLEHGRAEYGASHYGPAGDAPAAEDDDYGPSIPSPSSDGGIPYAPVYGDPSQENRTETIQMEVVVLDPSVSAVGIGLEVAADDDGSKSSVVRVVEILPDGAADLSTEVRVGDRIVAINGVRVNSGNLGNIEQALFQSTEKVELLLEHGKTLARRMSAKKVIQDEVYENVEQEVPEEEALPQADPVTNAPEIRVKWGTRTVSIVVQGEDEDCSIWYTTDGTDPQEKDELLWDETKLLEIPAQASTPGEVYIVHAIAQVKSGEKKMSKQVNFARALDSEAELPAPKISFNHTLQRIEIDAMFEGATVHYSHTEAPAVSEELEVTGGTAYDSETPVKPANSPGDNDIWAVSVMAGMKTSKVTRHAYEVMQSPTPKVWYDTGTLTLNTKDENPNAVIFYDWEGAPELKMNPKGRRVAQGTTTMCTSGTLLDVDTSVAGVKKLKACTVYPDCVPSKVERVDITVYQVSTPVFDYAAGVVTLASDFAGSTVFYTKDGSDPQVSRECGAENAATLAYNVDRPIIIDANLAGKRELRAIAVCVGSVHSEIAHIDVELEAVAMPKLKFDNKTISLKSTTPGAVVVFALNAQKRDAHTSIEISQGGKHTVTAHAKKDGMVTSADVTLELDIQQTAAPQVDCHDGVVTMDAAGSIFYQWDKAPSTPAAGGSLDVDSLEDGTLRFHPHERLVMEPGPHVIHAVAVEEGKLPSHVVTVGISLATKRAMIREVAELCPMKIPVKLVLAKDVALKKPVIATVPTPKISQVGARLEVKCANESALVIYDFKEGVPKMPEAYSGSGKGFAIDLPNPPDGDTLWFVATHAGMVPSKLESFKINLSKIKKYYEEEMSKAAKAARAALEAAEAEAAAAQEEAAAAEAAAAAEVAEAAAAAASAAAADGPPADETIEGFGFSTEPDATTVAEDEPAGFGEAAGVVDETPAAEPETSEPEAEPAAEEEAAPAVEPEPEPVAEPTAEPAAEPEPEPEPAPAPEPSAEPAAEPAEDAGDAPAKKKKKKKKKKAVAGTEAADTGAANMEAVVGEVKAKITAKSVGSRCKVAIGDADCEGTIRFVGKSHEPPNKARVGVELDDKVGKNNGTWKGHTYFECPAKHGVLVPKSKVTLL